MVMLLCVFLYWLRTRYADFIWDGGSDVPVLIMGGLRLHDTSLFAPLLDQQNTLFSIFTAIHGYSRIIIPYLTYYTCFELFGMTITEKAFILLHTLWGMCSLLAIYYFCRQFLSKQQSWIALFLIGLAPTLFNYQRSFLSPFSIELSFYYLGLAFLYQYISKKKNIARIGYAVSTAIYVGDGNTFFIGLLFQLFFFLWCQPFQPLRQRLLLLWQFCKHWSIVLFVVLPLSFMIACGIFFYLNHWPLGPLAHILMSRADAKNILGLAYFPVVPFLANLPLIIGPAVILLPYACIWLIKNKRKLFNYHPIAYLCLYLMVFVLLILLANRPGFWFAIMIVPPAIIVITIPTAKYYKFLLYLIMIVSPFWTFYLNYNNSAPTGAYGYVAGFYARFVENSGLKTLSYLIRTDTLPVTKTLTGCAIFMDYEGAWFYLGRYIHDWVLRDLENREHQQYDHYLIVNRIGHNSEGEQFIERFIDEQVINKQLYHIGSIMDQEKVLMELYANETRPYQQYHVQEFDKLFDHQFGNIESYAKFWLGGI